MFTHTVDAVHADSSQVLPAADVAPSYETLNHSQTDPLKRARRAAAAKQIGAGFLLLLIGLVITSISMAIAPGGFFVVTYGAIILGFARMVGGIWKLITC